MMRFFVCSGMERAAGELFRAAETVPGVSPRCSAMVLRVTLSSLRKPDFSLGGGVIQRTLRVSSKIGIWEMAYPSARVPPARFARRPVSRDSSSSWALSGEFSAHQPRTRLHPRTRGATRIVADYLCARRQQLRGLLALLWVVFLARAGGDVDSPNEPRAKARLGHRHEVGTDHQRRSLCHFHGLAARGCPNYCGAGTNVGRVWKCPCRS